MSVATAPAPARAVTRAKLIEELHREPGKAEIINGKVVRMSPAGAWHGKGASRILASLVSHELSSGGGHAFGDNVGFLVDLPDRFSFCPDAAWFAGDMPKEKRDSFLDGSPTFAAEVRSAGQYIPSAETDILKKVREYFAAGTKVVWDIDVLEGRWIKKYTPETIDNPQVFKEGDIADAEPAVPGWRFPVSESFT